MIKYTINKYDGHDIRETAAKNNENLTQRHIAEKIQGGTVVSSSSFYPTNNFLVLALEGSSVAIYQPQIWFLHFLYKNLPGGKKAIEFYIKHSYDVRERFTWANLNEELKTFVMAATLAEGT